MYLSVVNLVFITMCFILSIAWAISTFDARFEFLFVLLAF